MDFLHYNYQGFRMFLLEKLICVIKMAIKFEIRISKFETNPNIK